MPQSQTAANTRHQEEEKKDKTVHTQNKQTNVWEAQRPAPSSPNEVIRMLKQTEKRGQRAREVFKTPIAPWYKLQSYTELITSRFDFCIEYKPVDRGCPFHYQWPELFGFLEEIAIELSGAFLKCFSIDIEKVWVFIDMNKALLMWYVK